MLFHLVVKPGSRHVMPAEGGQIVHLSQACLLKPQSNATTYLKIVDGESAIALCALAKDKCEHASFDLFLPTDDDLHFVVDGPNEIHVSGYYEPEGDKGGFEFPEEEMESDEEAEEEEDEDEAEGEENLIATAKALPGKKLAALMPEKASSKAEKLAEELAAEKQLSKKGAAEARAVAKKAAEKVIAGQAAEAKAKVGGKAGKAPQQEKEEDEDEDDSDNDDEMTQSDLEKAMKEMQQIDSDDDEDDDDDDDDDDDEDEEVDTAAVMEAIKNAKANAQGVKRKAAEPPAAKQPPKKQAKKSAAPASPVAAAATTAASKQPKAKAAVAQGSDDSSKFQQAISEYLRAHGRTSVSQLGSQVKRPASVKKLGVFIKERPAIFKVENGFVTLVK